MRREALREIVRQKIETFRKKYGSHGNLRELAEVIKRDVNKHAWDADDLGKIDELMSEAKVTMEVYVNFDDDEPASGIMG